MMQKEPYVNGGSSAYGNSGRAPAGTSSGALEEEDEEEEEEEKNMVGFMFGNTEDLLDVDYLDEDAKEHLNAVADQLGGLPDLELLSTSSVSTLKDEEDYGRKLDSAVDYEDIDEAVEDDGELLPDEKEYYARAALFTESKQAEEENYDEDDEEFVSVAPPQVIADKSEYPGRAEAPGQPLSPGSLNTEHNFPAEVSVQAVKTLSPPVKLQAVTALSSPPVKHGDGLVSADISFEDLDEDWDDFDSEDDDEPYEDLSPDEEGADVVLPAIYEENGKQVLQFSEIFGAKQPHWIIGNKKLRSKRSVFKGKVETRLDRDEADVLRAFRENMAFEVHLGSDFDVKEDQSLYEQVDDTGKHRQHVSCEPLNRNLSPLVDIEGTQSANFDPIHQLDWENEIVWDDIVHGEDPEGWELTDKQYQATGNAVTLEPLSRPANPSRSGTKHPQMLRLETRRQHTGADLLKRLERLSLTLESRNTEFAAGTWLDDVCWDEPKSKQWKAILDLADSRMVFELSDTREANTKEAKIIREHAAAMVISPRSTKPRPAETAELTLPSRFNISNDKYYGAKKGMQQQKLQHKKRVPTGAVKVVHSVPALRLQTMKPKLNNKDLANFHRPKATWFPHHNEVAAKDQGALAVKGPMKVILKSLGGKGSRLHLDASDTLESFKEKAVKKFGDLKVSEPTKIMYAGRLLEGGKTFAEQKVPPNSLLHLIRTKVHFWRPQRLPSDKPTRPPGAFKKKSELSVKDGHVTLMEYCEERPLLLSNVGMGAVLSTYYRKTSPSDTTAATLKENWSGTIIPLEPAEESPFIGNLRLGEFQSCLETNMCRAPVFKHRVSSRDFLLVRSAKGKLSLRRIDNIHVVGQQEPHMEVIAPSSKTVLHYLGNRLLVYIFREFRSKEKPGVLPQIGAEELTAQFPALSDALIRKKLKNIADLQRGPNGDMRWVMRRGFRIPSEEELRRLVTPENVCTYESMQAGIHHLKRMGVHKLTQLNGLSAAMTQLPDEALTLAAATHIERELQLTPWNLSSNFVTATLQGRNCIEKLEISGPGDPSGRGLGFSYLRVALRPANAGAAVEKKAAAARSGGSVTGTDADLRRLSMEAAREVLLQFKVSEDEIDKLTRWHRIALIRKLSNDQVAIGSDLKMAKNELNKYARGQRVSAVQLQQQSKVKAQEIWDRQARNLLGSDEHSDVEVEDNGAGDLDDFAGDLENLLEAEEDDGKNVATKKELKDNVRGIGRRRALQAQLEEDLEDEAAEAAELHRLLMEDDEAEEDQRRKKAGTNAKEAVVAAPIAVTASAPVSAPTSAALPGFGPSNGRKRKKTVLKRTSHTRGPDGKMVKKVEVITDPIQVANYLAKKREREGQKANIGKGPSEKKVTIKTSKDKKTAPFINLNTQKSSKARDKICGGCGQVGHMRTNKKKCPLYAGGAALSRPEAEEIVDRPVPRVTIKKTVEPPPKVRVKFKSEAVTVKSSEPKLVTTNGHEPPVPAPTVTPLRIRIRQPRHNPEAETEKQRLEQESQPVMEERPIEMEQQEMAKASERSERVELQTEVADNLEKQGAEEVDGEKVGKKRHRSEEKQKKKKKRKKDHKERQKDSIERKVDVPQAQEVKSREQEQQKDPLKIVQQPQVVQPAPRIIIKPAKRKELPPEAPEPPPKRQKKRGGGEVDLANVLEEVVNKMRQQECSKLFRKAVTKREAPDYRDVISTPMDLSIIRDRARKFQYRNREDFLTDVQLIVDNAHTYNDFRHPLIPPEADKLFQVCEQLLEEREQELDEIESRIDDDDRVQQVVNTRPVGGGGGGGGGGRKRSLRTL